MLYTGEKDYGGLEDTVLQMLEQFRGYACHVKLYGDVPLL